MIRLGGCLPCIDPKQFEASFVQWVQGISQTVKGVVAIDGKTLRRSHDHAGRQESAACGECVGRGKSVGVGSACDGGEVQ